MELKELSLQDINIIRTLFSDVFGHEPWKDDWSDQKQLDTYLHDLIGQENSLTLGFFDSGRLAGLSMGHVKHWYTGTEYYIDEFCIAADLQGRGLGSAFMKEIEAYLKENGIVQIFLQTERTVPAYVFYQRQGFTELPDHVSFAKRID